MEVKEQIKRSISISDVVSLYVDLRPAGKYLKALCPFHTEKTPSFYVSPEKDSFSCYGCNTFGDIFTFIQEIESLSFPDAQKFLIDKFSIPINKKDSGNFVKKDLYNRINEIALKYFRTNLFDSKEGKKAQEYLKQRGISSKTIDDFQLGYALNKWDGLFNYLTQKTIDAQKSVELGLLIKNESQRIYDRFRGRIIFPIFSESGAPIAFGGRTIFDEQNKYLNSPDTPLYKKSNNLYGFNLTKTSMRKEKYSVLVEGYFDVVSLYQQGVQCVAASLGTALTEKQIYLLKRFSDKIYIFYDNDNAGVNAAARGIEMMFQQNINPGVITVGGDGVKDPDDFIKQHGIKGFNQAREKATDGFQFLIDNISKKYDLNIPEQKNDAIISIMNFVEKISEPIVRNGYLRMVADYFKVDESNLKINRLTRRDNSSDTTGPAKPLVITPAERIFLDSLLAMPALIGEIKELITDEVLSVLITRNIINLMVQNYNEKSGDIDDYKAIAAQLSAPERALFREIYVHAHTIEASKEEFEEKVESAYLHFLELVNKVRIKRIDQEIKIAGQQNDVPLINRLYTEKTKYITRKYEQNPSINIGGAVD
jgi:DNA primase